MGGGGRGTGARTRRYRRARRTAGAARRSSPARARTAVPPVRLAVASSRQRHGVRRGPAAAARHRAGGLRRSWRRGRRAPPRRSPIRCRGIGRRRRKRHHGVAWPAEAASSSTVPMTRTRWRPPRPHCARRSAAATTGMQPSPATAPRYGKAAVGPQMSTSMPYSSKNGRAVRRRWSRPQGRRRDAGLDGTNSADARLPAATERQAGGAGGEDRADLVMKPLCRCASETSRSSTGFVELRGDPGLPAAIIEE